jgi:hypothetical protein
MYPRFSSVDSGHVWLLIRGYINQLSGETPTDLRVGTPMPIPTTNLTGLPRLSAKQQLTRHFSPVKNPVNWETGSRRNLSAFFCSELRLTLPTQFFGLLHSFLDT